MCPGLHRPWSQVVDFSPLQGFDYEQLARPPDLILTDLMMSRLSGDQLIREVRSRRELDAVPIVLLTAKADEESRSKLLASGAQDYVIKPFSGQELRARVGSLVVTKRARELLQKELASRTQDLEALVREITLRNAELEEFAYAAAHQLQEPLRKMAIFAQLLAQRHNSEMGPQANQYIELVSGACGKMRRLVEDLLQYTRTVRTHGDLQPIDCENLVWESLENLKQAIDETGATITHDPLPSVLADPPRLRVCSQNRI